MYADTAEKHEATTAELKALQHEAFVSRVLTFLHRQEEWVQLYRFDVLTRGHNTNNFAEATICMLKDIILNRVEAFNAVALVHSDALVWEKYFESRILRHAYIRVAAHQLLYKRLLSRVPKDAAEAIQAKKCGGLFPNAPALSTDDRYQLGQLALGEKCPSRIFFEPFQEEEPSSSAKTTEGTSAQQEKPDELQLMQGTSTQEATHVAPVPSVPDAAQLAQNSSDGTEVMLALKAIAAPRRRRARHIRVQPTSTARRRPGLTRGSKRVPTGRPAVEPAAKRAKKRPHFLSHNIEKNVPGARLH
ncbi:hypothetical protein MRX96_032497 [Rhipicephalus microplus]